jgi:hypothetical protein
MVERQGRKKEEFWRQVGDSSDQSTVSTDCEKRLRKINGDNKSVSLPDSVVEYQT